MKTPLTFYRQFSNDQSMTAEDRIIEQKKRLEKIKRWPGRVEKLRIRRKKPMSEAEFCEKHQIQPAWFNRLKNGGGEPFPSKTSVERIEKALKAEGV